MNQAPVSARPGILAGIGVRQIRLACGLILFTYLLSHFANHALGNISYAAMEQGLDYHMQFWRYPIVAVVFYTAAVVHWMLGLWALYRRRQFRYRGPELTQLLLGLSIPFLIVIHLVNVRVSSALFERDVYYSGVFYAFWVSRPYMHWVQYALLLVAWTHGCIGLYFWLRLKGFFRRAAPYLLAAAVLMPTLALLGLVQGSREVIALSASPEWRANSLGPPLPEEERRTLDDIIAWSAAGYAAALALIFVARAVRTLAERRGGLVKLSYPGGRVVQIPRGACSKRACATAFRTRASAADERAARRAAYESSATSLRCRARRRARPSCWLASARAPIPRCASPASCVPKVTSRSFRSSDRKSQRRRFLR
jgi:adenylate cyclase